MNLFFISGSRNHVREHSSGGGPISKTNFRRSKRSPRGSPSQGKKTHLITGRIFNCSKKNARNETAAD